MNRREFLRRSLTIAGSLGLPAGVAIAAPHPATFSLEGKSIYGGVVFSKEACATFGKALYQEIQNAPPSFGSRFVGTSAAPTE